MVAQLLRGRSTALCHFIGMAAHAGCWVWQAVLGPTPLINGSGRQPPKEESWPGPEEGSMAPKSRSWLARGSSPPWRRRSLSLIMCKIDSGVNFLQCHHHRTAEAGSTCLIFFERVDLGLSRKQWMDRKGLGRRRQRRENIYSPAHRSYLCREPCQISD